MLLCAGLFWGSGNVANKTVPDHIGPFSALGYRCALTILVIAPFLAVFSSAGAFVLVTLAQAHLPASMAAVLASAESVFGAKGGIFC